MARPKTADPVKAAENKRLAMLEASRNRTRAGSDIGEVPKCVNPERRKSCRLNLAGFLEVYFPQSTGLSPFSADHVRVIGRIQDCILRGGRFTNAVYRGFAKSTISENSLLWGVLYGHRRFGAIFAGEGGLAEKAISSIKIELAENDLLFEDFPEVCHAVRALEGKPQRCLSQTCGGEKTYIGWSADRVVFPAIAGSVAGGAIIMAKGLTGSILGLRHKSADGKQLRPDFVIVDDPQTRESAASPMQCSKRLEILQKSVVKLAGHTKQIAVVVNATVIQQEDMVDQLLDQKKFPAWQGERIPMVREWSKHHEDLWLGKYREIRNTFATDIVGDQARAHREANQFYADNRAAMDDGCVVSWESCYDPDAEASAIQHAYNALIDDGPDVFASEFQQQPLANSAQQTALTQAEVRARAIEVPRWIVPRGCDTLTAFVDVQEAVLYWLVGAWGHQLRGHVVAYGTYPEQTASYYTLRDVKKTLAKAAGGASLEAAIEAGLEAVAADLLDREFARENDDAVLRVGQLLIDANWARSTGVVRDFARRSRWGPRVLPAHGRFVGASSSMLTDKRPDRGERVGSNWRTSTIGRQRHVLYDTNAWKSLVSTRCKLQPADVQSLTVHAGAHEMLAEQWSAEYPVRVEARGRTVDEWRLIPGRDNHWWDCVVGAAVAASFIGVSAVGAEARPTAPRKTITREGMAARRAELMARMGR
ncbi:MAG: hypothetical protein EBR82_44965 [Caulobacteraceae bacterium]|nr:hypothetical protein [Caulobacteraceae bacterium]